MGMYHVEPETDPERLRAEVARLAENHDQVVRWLREKEAEIAELKAEVARLREGLAQKNDLIVAKDRRLYALEHPWAGR